MTTVPSVTNQQINSVVVNEQEHNPYFVYYLLRTMPDILHNVAGGVATPIVNKSTFANLEACVPPLPTQRKIAAILSTFDNLKENNTRRIKILEDMAQTLYREWFVHYQRHSIVDISFGICLYISVVTHQLGITLTQRPVSDKT